MECIDTLPDRLHDLAAADLRQDHAIRPRLAAAHDDRLLFLAQVRPHPPGGYHRPLIELLALAAGLQANRLAVATGAHARPLEAGDDRPIDRTPVLLVVHADGSTDPVRVTSILTAYQQSPDGPSWGEADRMSDGEGWIPEVLGVAAGHPWPPADPAEVDGQLRRCRRLGHRVTLTRTAEHLMAPASP